MAEIQEDRREPATADLGRITQSAVRDIPAGLDALGFAPYVAAIAAFLDSPATQPPFTLSLEGEWGCGKSSFMKQLKDALSGPGCSPSIPVSFNAWRFDKQDALWSAFALAVTRELRHKCTYPQRIRGAIRLFAERVVSPAAWLRLIQFVALWVFFLSACIFTLFYLYRHPVHQAAALKALFAVKTPEGQIPPFYAKLLSSGAWAGAVGVLAAILAKSGSWLKSHLFDIKFEKLIAQPDYAGHAAFIEDFHRDFSATVRAYAGNRKVYVFVDDLDRCDLLKAAELMQAINLMIGEDDHLVFILGIDRDKIAAGIAAKYKDILPFIVDTSGDSASISMQDRLAFGHQYLEKFIQLSFRIPLPDEQSVLRHFVERLTPDIKEVKPRSFTRKLLSRVLPITDLAFSPTAEVSAASPPSPEPARTFIRIESGRDSERIVDIVLMVSHLFGNNPRRLKQFLNAYRLSLYLASAQGLLDVAGDRPPLTLEQLGKLVALQMRFPALSRMLLDDPKFLAKCESWIDPDLVHERDEFKGEEPPPPWILAGEVGKLLRFGLDRPDYFSYTLRPVDVTTILRVMPTIPAHLPAERGDLEIPLPTVRNLYENGKFSAVMTNVGPDKLEAMKAIRQITGGSQEEARHMVYNTPSTIFDNLSRNSVERIRDELAGLATVRLVEEERNKATDLEYSNVSLEEEDATEEDASEEHVPEKKSPAGRQSSQKTIRRSKPSLKK